jgi:hypothetical protein
MAAVWDKTVAAIGIGAHRLFQNRADIRDSSLTRWIEIRIRCSACHRLRFFLRSGSAVLRTIGSKTGTNKTEITIG